MRSYLLATKLNDLEDLSCPLCGKVLASNEYLIAKQELEKKLAERYSIENKKREETYQQQLKEIRDNYEKTTAELKIRNTEQLELIKKELKESYDKQLLEVRKMHDDIQKQNEELYVKKKEQLENDYKKTEEDMEKQIKTLQDSLNQQKQFGYEEAKVTFTKELDEKEQEIKQKEIQIKRFQNDISELEKKLVQSQSELKGEVGELDLYATLTSAFHDDHFRRQKRGSTSGDLIQKIRTNTGTIDTQIIYDNKEANTVTKSDIEKAKKYMKIHGTKYVLIVSRNLPKKEVKNGLLGEKDGILLVHPSIVVEVATQIRTGIIEISKLSKSKGDQKSKESKLYNYIISQDFSMILESLDRIHKKLFDLQTKEEKEHQTLWKSRKELQEQLIDTYNDISSGIESITQEEKITESVKN